MGPDVWVHGSRVAQLVSPIRLKLCLTFHGRQDLERDSQVVRLREEKDGKDWKSAHAGIRLHRRRQVVPAGQASYEGVIRNAF